MKNRNIFAFAGAVIAWFAVVAQIVTTYVGAETNSLLAALGLFNYFTILSNTIVAISFSLMSYGLKKGLFASHAAQTAIAVYIIVVGIVYSLLLRNTWNPQGFQKVVDELLHTVVPVIYVVYWFVFTPKRIVKYSQIWLWLIFPALYLTYSLVKGAVFGNFPYPFLNASSLGWLNVILVSLLLTLFVIILSFLLVWINRLGARG